MDEDILRQFIRETISEIKLDPLMMKFVRGEDPKHATHPGSGVSQKIADQWLKGFGGGVSPRDRAVVTRFVARRWPGLVKRYHGNILLAQQTMNNILDSRFHDLKVYG